MSAFSRAATKDDGIQYIALSGMVVHYFTMPYWTFLSHSSDLWHYYESPSKQPTQLFRVVLEILAHLQELMRIPNGSSDCQLLQILCWFILGGMRQRELFTGTLQGERGGGTNPVVKMGLSLRGHHLQAGSEDAESRGCEAVLQITVWRADAVTFVCWWRVTLSATGWNIMCFLCGCIIQNQRGQRVIKHSNINSAFAMLGLPWYSNRSILYKCQLLSSSIPCIIIKRIKILSI